MKNPTTYLVVALILSCAHPPSGSARVANPSELPRIAEIHADRLANLKTGKTTYQEFVSIFPSARLAGEADGVLRYDVIHQQRYVTNSDITRQNWIWGAGSPNPHVDEQRLSFFFSDNVLTKWEVAK